MGQSWDNHGTIIGQSCEMSWDNHRTIVILEQSWDNHVRCNEAITGQSRNNHGTSMLIHVKVCVLLPAGCRAGGRSCGAVQHSHEGCTRLPGATVNS